MNEYFFFKKFILREAELGEILFSIFQDLKDHSIDGMVGGQHVKCQRADDSDDVRRKLSLELLWLMELVLS